VKISQNYCKSCPLSAKKYQYVANCGLYWAQLPYEEGENDEQ
jgi:hypothetical protein